MPFKGQKSQTAEYSTCPKTSKRALNANWFCKENNFVCLFSLQSVRKGKEKRKVRGGVVLNLNQNNLKLGKGGNSKRQVKEDN